MIELQADPDDLPPEWLTSVLQSSGEVSEAAKITSFTHTRIGTGKLGDNVRFELDWAGDAEGAPPSIVGKFASTDPTSRQAGLMTGIYVREISFFQELADKVRMRIPRHHYAGIDMDTGAFAVIMEDIRPARQGSQVDACTLDDAALAMEQLALLHSSMWSSPDLSGREWLTARSENGGEGLAAIYAMFVAQFLTQYEGRLSDRAAQAAERFTPLVGAWLCSDDGGPLTLLHGDYRLENMLFGDGPAAPPLTTVDWQTVGVGAGPSDAAYFLGAGLHTEDRRSHERDLLEVYRRGLVSQGVELSEDDCWRSYRVNAFAGLHMAVVASVLVGRTEHGDEMFLAMAERHSAHVDDMDAWDLVTG
jgi:hypothetical protein